MKTCDPGAGSFWPQGYDLNKLGRGPLGDAIYKILKLNPTVSDKKICSCFAYIRLYKTCDPRGNPFLVLWA